MGDDYTDIKSETRKALEEVEVYDVVVKVDLDDDGLAEMYRVVYGEGKGGSGTEATYVVLEVAPVSEAPYTEVVIERDAHQFEGHSVFEDTKDIQRVNTVILTGATSTARLFLRLRPGLHLAAETGGKNALIITAMADRDLAIKDLIVGFGKPVVFSFFISTISCYYGLATTGGTIGVGRVAAKTG